MMECTRSDAADLLKGWTSAAAGNYAHIHNSAYDLLMRISEVSSSAEARDAYLSDAERLLLESGYVVPICFATDSWQLNENLTGVFGDGMGQYFFTSVVKKPK
jgi:ABC-type oligopeptide transport system substrate-binding subunit